MLELDTELAMVPVIQDTNIPWWVERAVDIRVVASGGPQLIPCKSIHPDPHHHSENPAHRVA